MTHFPNHLHIETVAGYCTSNCIMCNVDQCDRKGIMDMATYSLILSKFKHRVADMQFLTIHGMGEPTLDLNLVEKVRLAKAMGFPGVGFATNATHLYSGLSRGLLKAGLDTIIFSVDGINSETHERIRRGTKFYDVIKNINAFLEERVLHGQTKVIVRMIRMDLNRDEWEDYKKHWEGVLNSRYGDEVSVHDVISYDHEESQEARERRAERIRELARETRLVCPDITTRMLTFLDGRVALCCRDEYADLNLGNILTDEPEAIYNGPVYQYFRKMMEAGRLQEIGFCKDCPVILAGMEKEYIKVGGEHD